MSDKKQFIDERILNAAMYDHLIPASGPKLAVSTFISSYTKSLNSYVKEKANSAASSLGLATLTILTSAPAVYMGFMLAVAGAISPLAGIAIAIAPAACISATTLAFGALISAPFTALQETKLMMKNAEKNETFLAARASVIPDLENTTGRSPKESTSIACAFKNSRDPSHKVKSQSTAGSALPVAANTLTSQR